MRAIVVQVIFYIIAVILLLGHEAWERHGRRPF